MRTHPGLASLVLLTLAGSTIWFSLRPEPDPLVVAIRQFERRGDVRELAMLGARAAPAVEMLAEQFPSPHHRDTYADIAITLGIIGTPEAEAALTKWLDGAEKYRDESDRFAYQHTAPLLVGLALVDTPTSRLRILRYHPDRFGVDTKIYRLMADWEIIPDEPALIVRAVESAPSPRQVRAIALNLTLAYQVSQDAGIVLPKVLAESDALADAFIFRELHFSSEEDSRDWRSIYLHLLNAFTTDTARRWIAKSEFAASISSAASENSPMTPEPFATGDEIFAHASDSKYAHGADRFRIVTDATDFSRSDALVEGLNGENEYRLLSRVNDPVRVLRELGPRVVPTLVRLMEESEPLPYGDAFTGTICRRQLTYFRLLKRATGQNFGLDGDAWIAWWEAQQR